MPVGTGRAWHAESPRAVRDASTTSELTEIIMVFTETTASQLEPGGRRRAATATGRILVAEDNEAMLRLLARHLRSDGHEVIEARNGFELMHWVDLMVQSTGEQPLLDLIVTDLRMPMYSGQQCLEELRMRGLATPVIMVTAFGSDEVHRAALASGATVFDKPLKFEELLAAVRELL